MSISINSSNYGAIDKNSAQYKAARAKVDAGEALNGGFKTKEQQLIDEVFGGKEARIRNWMRYFDADGDFIDPVTGLAGLNVDGKHPSEYQQIISISDKGRQSMWNMVKSEFIENYGVHNGDTTKRSDVYLDYYKSIPKEDRLKAEYTLQQYERSYYNAIYNIVKEANPNWKIGDAFDTSILNHVTLENISGSSRSDSSRNIDIGI